VIQPEPAVAPSTRKFQQISRISQSGGDPTSGVTVALGPGVSRGVLSKLMMDFRTSATQELSDLVDRLTAAAEEAARAAREEAAAEAQARFDAIAAQRATLEHALQEQTTARQTLEQSLLEHTNARHALEHALQEHTDIRRTLEHDKASLETNLAELRKEAEAVRARVKALGAESETLHAEAETSRADAELLRAEIATLREQNEALHGDAETLRAETDKLRGDADTLREESNALLAESDKERQEIQSRLDEALRAAAEAAARTAEWRAEEGRAIRNQAVALVSRTLDRLLAVSAAFANVSTEDEVLAAVVESLATEFPRVALFKAGLNRLDAVRHVGFEFPADPTHLVIPQAIGTVIDRAVTSGQIEILSAEAVAAVAGTPFGGSIACAMALPIDLEGDACAVFYADDADQPHQAFAHNDLRRTYALLLRQLAGPLLLRLPAEKKAIVELREYAAHLVAELENMYAADATTYRKGSELRRRLQDNLECARGIFAQRVTTETPAAARLLEAELALAANGAHGTAFGRDLTALLGAPAARAAEA
jgi:hypothetical protein